jgi:hypothetical protein
LRDLGGGKWGNGIKKCLKKMNVDGIRETRAEAEWRVFVSAARNLRF